ncbi:MAG: hypothetical protein DI551_09355, partial [Micavibrio aeruginosavorus]
MTQIENSRSFLFPAALWFLAFVCAVYPINEYQLQFFMGAIVLLFGWFYAMLARDMNEGWNLPRSPVLMLAGAFWLLVLLSAFWSI